MKAASIRNIMIVELCVYDICGRRNCRLKFGVIFFIFKEAILDIWGDGTMLKILLKNRVLFKDFNGI